ncbi:MAG: hypothetical protein V9G18_22175 [Albidovulum sp.]
MKKYRISVSTCFIVMIFASYAYAAKPFEGVWAETQAECLDKEGPNSRTLIDLANKDKGKPLPIFDRYEWHCKVLKLGGNDKKTTLKLRCFEFWEHLEKGTDGTDAEVALMPESKQTLRIDGKKFVRCKD